MRALRATLAAFALFACGDNESVVGEQLAASGHLVVVAHPDDDLYFMQPDLLDALRSNSGVTSVYITAGNGPWDAGASDPRYAGLRYAYGSAAGSTDWGCGGILINDHRAQHCRLRDKHVSLIFLGYPDGGKQGQYQNSLLDLWEGTVSSARTVAHETSTYTRDELIETLAEIVTKTQPATIHTLEVAATHGDDHSDHMIVGALTVLAVARVRANPELISYRGYSITQEPVNKLPEIVAPTLEMASFYEACASKCSACGSACSTIEDSHVAWLSRRYAVGFRRRVAGRLQLGTLCLTKDLTLGACSTAPVWRSDPQGRLQSADRECLAISSTGDASITGCDERPEQRFFVDDEGHIWSGVPPVPHPQMDYAHLWCLAPTDTGGVRALLCGRDNAPTWEVAPSTKSTPREALGFAESGRDVRLGDVTGDGRADLCTLQNGVLTCAIGDGTGGFATPAVKIGDMPFSAGVYPGSLVLGDVDGDRRQDACARDSAGIVCGTAAHQFAPTRWSSVFDHRVEQPTTSASLAAVDADGDGTAEICGGDADGVVCASPDRQWLLSPWPAPGALVWPADLDGDAQADWCSAAPSELACGVEAQASQTRDGSPWAFVHSGVVDMSNLDATTASFADIDGDLRADACAPRDDRIVCARSQGRGFGPRATAAILPSASAATALWLGDLDGDGDADVCADIGSDIVCAVETH